MARLVIAVVIGHDLDRNLSYVEKSTTWFKCAIIVLMRHFRVLVPVSQLWLIIIKSKIREVPLLLILVLICLIVVPHTRLSSPLNLVIASIRLLLMINHGTRQVSMGNGDSVLIVNIGTSNMQAGFRLLRLQNVLHVPTVCKNLLSVGQFARDNAIYFEFHPMLYFVKDILTKKTLLVGRMHNGFYKFDTSRLVSNSSGASFQPSVSLYIA